MSSVREWQEIPKMWLGMSPVSEIFQHVSRPLTAIRSRDCITDDGDMRWHLSISHQDRIPTWEEIGIARDALLPGDVHFCIPHPPRRFWLNYNHRVLHLWEVCDTDLTDFFEWEGQQARLHGHKGEPS